MDKLLLKECIDLVINEMRSKHYSESSVNQYRRYFTDFLFYCTNKGIQYFDEMVAIDYVNNLTGLGLTSLGSGDKDTRKYVVLLRAMRILSQYSLNQIFCPRFSKFYEPVSDENWKSAYNGFINYISNDCDDKDSTVTRKEYVVRRTISILSSKRITSFKEITPGVIEVIISTFIHETPKSVTHNIGILKQFFRFCYESGMHNKDLSLLFKDIKTPHQTKIPVSFSDDEVKKLLESIDRDDPKGKRNYAIIMLASHLGFRAIDIINLKLSDINWSNKTISITQEKTGSNLTLPLLNDVGWSLIDYIKNGRPKIDCDCDYVFIRHIPPYDRFKDSGALSTIFKKVFHDAGLNINRDVRFGIHSLRHTLGTLMLEKETPLPVISQVLGHQSIKSTETYLRLNMEGLKECPIDPERVFNK